MKSLSVSDFKAHLAEYLRDVKRGERYIITEHRRPVAEVREHGADEALIARAAQPFSIRGIEPALKPQDRFPGLAMQLVREDRGE